MEKNSPEEALKMLRIELKKEILTKDKSKGDSLTGLHMSRETFEILLSVPLPFSDCFFYHNFEAYEVIFKTPHIEARLACLCDRLYAYVIIDRTLPKGKVVIRNYYMKG